MTNKNINWNEVQNSYDLGLSLREIIKKFHLTNSAIYKAVKLNLFKTRNISDATKLSRKLKPVFHTQESKKKMSESRKKYLQKNPDKVTYLVNRFSTNPSYPERYFANLLRETDFVYKFRIYTYELDFANLNLSVDLEIDGQQHKQTQEAIQHDIKRNNKLIDNGWKVIRVYWPEFQKLNKLQKAEIINSIKTLNPFECNAVSLFGWENKNFIKYENCQQKFFCENCSNEKSRCGKLCRKCTNLKNRKVFRPSKEELNMLIQELSMVAIGKKFGVSDNSVRKWCAYYNINL